MPPIFWFFFSLGKKANLWYFSHLFYCPPGEILNLITWKINQTVWFEFSWSDIYKQQLANGDNNNNNTTTTNSKGERKKESW